MDNNLGKPASRSKETVISPLIMTLLETLESEDVLYCHWKSNDKLELSAIAETDLDLLIDRAQAWHFTRILVDAGFKQAVAPQGRRIHGIIDYFGYDELLQAFVHVHAHYQLVLGHDTSKNYRLPIEQAFLQSSRRSGLFRVPAPCFDYIVLVIRVALKRLTWDSLLIRNSRVSDGERKELDWLRRQVSDELVSSCLESNLPFLSRETFNHCERPLFDDVPIVWRVWAGHKLLVSLGAFGRRSRPCDVMLKFARRIRWAVDRKILKRSDRYRLANGGLFVAFVGGDGAGKSSAIEQLDNVLSVKFDVLRLHLGKPPKSLTTWFVRATLKIGSILGFHQYVDHTLRFDTQRMSTFAGYACLLRETCMARDRYLAYRRALRFATNGGLVLCDRFPLPSVQLMDGPVVEQLAGDKSASRRVQWLKTIEESFYERIVTPEFLFVLKVDPDTAVARKPEENETFVRMRSDEIWRVADTIPDAQVIDTSDSMESVSKRIWRRVWTGI